MNIIFNLATWHLKINFSLFMVILQILMFSADVFKFMLVIWTSFHYKIPWYIQNPSVEIIGWYYAL